MAENVTVFYMHYITILYPDSLHKVGYIHVKQIYTSKSQLLECLYCLKMHISPDLIC